MCRCSAATATVPTIPTDTYRLHSTFDQTHEAMLKKTTKQQGFAYSGALPECRGCSIAKRLRRPIARSTHTRAVKNVQRVLVDLSGPMVVQSIDGRPHKLNARDNCTRFSRAYFPRQQSDVVSAFHSFLAVASRRYTIRSHGRKVRQRMRGFRRTLS